MLVRLSFAQSTLAEGNAVYLQSQNSNLASELLCLLPDVQASPYFASQTFGTILASCCEIQAKVISDTVPDAVNIWIGDGKSATSLHKDP